MIPPIEQCVLTQMFTYFISLVHPLYMCVYSFCVTKDNLAILFIVKGRNKFPAEQNIRYIRK